MASMLESMLKWERTTPLGSPSLPLLKIRAAVSSTEIRRVAPASLLEQPDRCQAGQRQGGRPVAFGRSPGRTSSIQITSTPVGQLERGLLDEGPAGDHGPQPGLSRGRAHRRLARGEVQVDHDASGNGRGQVHQGPCHARRQQDPHGILPLPAGAEARGPGRPPPPAP